MYGHRQENDLVHRTIVGIANDLAIGDTYRPIGCERWRKVVAKTTTLHRDEVVVGYTMELATNPNRTFTIAHDGLLEVEYEILVETEPNVILELTPTEAAKLRALAAHVSSGANKDGLWSTLVQLGVAHDEAEGDYLRQTFNGSARDAGRTTL